MIRFIKQKLIHKKWMVVCLLIGNILLAAIASSNPMYQDAALEKTLKSKYSNYIEETNKDPGVITFNSMLNSGKANGSEFKQMQDTANGAAESLGVDQKYLVSLFETSKVRGEFEQSRGNKTTTKSMRIAMMSDMKDHISVLAGECYGDERLEDGALPVILSQRAMSKLDVVLGDEMSFEKLKNADGSNIKVKIVGVFDAKDYSDNYWVQSPSEYYLEVFTSPKLFESIFVNYDKPAFNITGQWNLVYDYESVRPGQVNSLVKNTETLCDAGTTGRNSTVEEPDYLAVLRDYQTTAKKVSTTLLILQIPVLALLLAFIFMISRQMLDLEQNEIALLKSRGSSRNQILLIYTLQSAILSIGSSIVGVPLGFFMTKALGSTNGFLEFIQRKALHVSLSPSVFLYTL